MHLKSIDAMVWVCGICVLFYLFTYFVVFFLYFVSLGGTLLCTPIVSWKCISECHHQSHVSWCLRPRIAVCALCITLRPIAGPGFPSPFFTMRLSSLAPLPGVCFVFVAWVPTPACRCATPWLAGITTSSNPACSAFFPHYRCNFWLKIQFLVLIVVCSFASAWPCIVIPGWYYSA